MYKNKYWKKRYNNNYYNNYYNYNNKYSEYNKNTQNNYINTNTENKEKEIEKNKEIEKLKNIINILKEKNSLLKQENRFLKNQIKEMKKNNNKDKDKIIFHESKSKNFIKAEYTISENEVNQDIRILNHDEQNENYSYDSYGYNSYVTGTDNQEEIEESCRIYFENKQINFNETFNFYKPGTYSFIFEFKYKLNNINKLFYDCKNLFSIDFRNFDVSSLKEFKSVFDNCENLKYIDFSNVYLPKGLNSNSNFYGVHSKCRLISKDNILMKTFEQDKSNYEHKDDYYDDYD